MGAEATEVVKEHSRGSALGVDKVLPELLMALDVVGLSWLIRLCNIAWTSGTVLLKWHTGVVVPLFNKRDQRVYSNYQQITLLSLPRRSTRLYWRGESSCSLNLGFNRSNVVFILDVEH